MRSIILTVGFALWALNIGAANADGETAGEFDYYVLALSWSPNWCALEGDARGSDQCDSRHDYGWTLHGLWPQFHRGWPSYCHSSVAPPSRQMSAEMSGIMGSAGLAWHQWKKHGTCSGLSAQHYYALMRQAYASISRPAVFRKLDKGITLPAALVETAFLQANPFLGKDMLTVTCRDGYIQEARVCLSKDLTPVPCGRDVIRDCRLKNARLAPVR
ncbi:ribonuclease T2 [Parasedimentitalea psychrophila]|uniref:Ribonuclease T2 n=1 Tax=Parasedimentitalea psychrophila TaxID=2997337 RepID=A0A9Y2L1S5_9RHOB|nr:ribonuclease T2 [Parasedimentitalea psychrophila]WIY27185.1 ribonuclease T2 [Parasedimentitalea psychrophila]